MSAAGGYGKTAEVKMNIETQVKKVSIYRAGCVMTGEGKVTLAPGTHQCRIEGLTSGTVSDSVRVRTSEGLTVSGVQVKYLDGDEQKELTRETDDKIALTDARISACDTLAELWKKNISFSHRNGEDLDVLLKYAEMLPEKLEECAQKKAELQKEKEKLLKDRKEIEEKLSRPYISAFLTCEAEGTYYLQTEFQDGCASWNPVYEIRAEGEDEPLLLRLRAAMRQNTDIDWKQVGVSLYTGNPSVSANIPVLPETHLKIREEARPMANMMRANNMMMGMAMAGAQAKMAMEDTVEMALNEEAADGASINEGETMTEFELSGLWDIACDGNDVMAELDRKQIPCTYHVVSVPKKDSSAYLAAEIKTADIEDIMNSRASVYLKGTFAGEVVINADLTKETYDLSLGKDETVRVKREQKKKYTSGVLLKGQTKTEYIYEITVLSNKKKDCRITIFDQIPVSDEKTIIVDKGEISGGKLNEESGEIRWDLDLKPQEKKVFTIAYNVAWPKDKKIEERTVQSGTRFCPVCGSRVYGRFCPECGSAV